MQEIPLEGVQQLPFSSNVKQSGASEQSGQRAHFPCN